MFDDKDPYTLFGFAFGISSFAGLAALLRSGKSMSTRLIVSALLNSGLFGMAVAMCWRELYGDAKHPWFMLGVSLLAGLGGTSLIDFVFVAAKEALRLYATRAAQAAPLPLDEQQPPPPPYSPYSPPYPNPAPLPLPNPPAVDPAPPAQ